MNVMKGQKQTIAKDNRAFTLIEMIIGLAIASMVILAVYSFMSVGTRSYESANRNTKLQEEMQLSNNYIGDAIMNGSMAQTKYVDNGNIRMFYTGNQVFYFNKGLNKFAVYGNDEAVGADIDEHLVTDCMAEFKVEFLATDPETTQEETESAAETETEEEITETEENTIYTSTNMVKITTTYAVKDQKLNSEKIYVIRNK